MGLIEESDVRKLMQDPQLVSEIASAVVDDPETMDDLADTIADKLSDELEDNSDLRQSIISTAVANPEFKRRIVKKLVSDLS